MKALVTGGSGFIGSNLVDRLLDEGHHVTVLDNLSTGKLSNLDQARMLHSDRLKFVRMDIRDPQTRLVVAEAHADVVFHLAAQLDVRVSVKDPVFDAEVNILGGLNVLEGCREGGVQKVCFASSGGTIYGEDETRLPFDETCVQQPVSPYGAAKSVFGQYLSIYKQQFGIDYVALALANVYGPRQDPFGEGGVVAIFAEHMLSDQPCTIFGDGAATRDFVHVYDVAQAFVSASESGSGLYNIGSNTETSINQLYWAIATAVGVSQEPAYQPARAGEVKRSLLAIAKAQTELSWNATLSLTEGVDTVLAHLRQSLPVA